MLKELSSVQEFIEFISQPDQRQLFVYFTATKKENGQPWCPDCATADPVIMESLKSLNEERNFVIVRIDRPYWKESPNNVLKNEHGIKCLPTLVKWGKSTMLGEEECKDKNQVAEYLSQAS